MSEKNRLLTPEEVARGVLDSWNKTMKPHLDKMKAEGASDEEVAGVANAAIAYAFGGLWMGPQSSPKEGR